MARAFVTKGERGREGGKHPSSFPSSPFPFLPPYITIPGYSPFPSSSVTNSASFPPSLTHLPSSFPSSPSVLLRPPFSFSLSLTCALPFLPFFLSLYPSLYPWLPPFFHPSFSFLYLPLPQFILGFQPLPFKLNAFLSKATWYTLAASLNYAQTNRTISSVYFPLLLFFVAFPLCCCSS